MQPNAVGRPWIFQAMNSVGEKNLSLKNQSFTLSGVKNIGIRKSEFVTKTQFLYALITPFIILQIQYVHCTYYLVK